MERAAASSFSPAAVAFVDGLGERHNILDPTGTETLEVLCVRDELAAVPSFEFALRERVSRLATFRHASFARVRAVERLTDRHATLAVVSEATTGIRLSDLLAQSADRRVNLDINSALCLIRQLVPAIAALHEHARDIQGFAHAAIGPERLVVTPNGRLMVVEYVMGAALEQLRYPPDRYWHELRLAVPRTASLPRFDHRVDVAQIGIVALSLILGRLVRDEEYPSRVGDVVASTWAISARGGFEPLPPGLRGWLGRTLQLDSRTGFATAAEARAELEKLLGDSEHLAAPASLEAFLSRFQAPEQPAAGEAPAKTAPVADIRREIQLEVKPESKPEPKFDRADPPIDLRSFLTTPTPSPLGDLRTTPEPIAASPSPGRFNSAAPPAAFQYDPPAAESRRPFDVEPASFDRTPPRPPLPKKMLMIGAAVAVAVLGGGYVVAQRFFAEPAAPVEAAAQTGTLVVTSNPDGVATFVDGEQKGTTPLTLTLSVGPHVLELRGPGEPRSIPITVTAGMQSSQYIELPKTIAKTGQLQIRTEPSGARVTVDGIARGTSPITVAELTPGEHAVVLESDHGSVKESVIVESGVTASLVVPLTAAQSAPVSGWMSVKAPVDVQIFEDGRLLGTNMTDRIMVTTGAHDIEIVNEALGYRIRRNVQVAAGRVSSVAVEMPKGTLAVNAQPWAEVWIDGERIGETPIGNLSMSIGSHSVLFRHPQLGEQHHTALVTLKGPTRLSVDMRKQQ
jgi:serine/threonine protein kinase